MNLKNIVKSTIFGMIITVFCSCEPVNNTLKNQLKYVDTIDSLMIKSYNRDLFNGNVLVVKNDTVIYQKSFGYTDASQKIKLNDTSIFNIGSIAKEFNGVAIMMLQERGLLTINDTISKFNLNLPDWSKKVTIKHLLNYTSGIAKIDFLTTKSDKIAWEILRKSDHLFFEPGSDFLYDNSNVFLQKRIIESVTGLSFEDFVTENIIRPLKLTNVVFDPKTGYPNRTSCYDANKVSCPEIEFISGWLWTDINNLNKWINAMNSNILITQESFDTLLKNPYVDGKTASIGEYFEELKLQRHDGTSYKFKSVYLNDFKNNITIILLSNNGNNVIPKAHTIHNILLDKPYKSVGEAIKKECVKNVDLGIKAYYNLKNSNTANQYTFDNPRELTKLGYELLEFDRIQDARKIFQLLILEFPNHANAYDSLGETYFIEKQYDIALKNYKKAVELGGTNGNAKTMIKKITMLKNK
ncbi:serine hydrolase [Aquimarina aggregata]|uniref:Serine hydrolase n=1 Tax=Aquimarina aggregata TaxID=1642818 RepID=A0A162DM23_9FLAO|nr:serine hydrolase domain-containing protein [Aquimarina aggregata]KZS42448.1 serine hydrolase [Aquimarina aggregata]